MSELQHTQAVSPFDAIRETRLDGSEFWSARMLMPLLGYSTWQHFEVPLHRAIRSAENQNHDVATLFTASRKNNTGGRPQIDYELSRFAAYLVAMNGDPNKPEVAAAQAYFAIRTREAETATPALPQTREERLALAVIDAQAMLAEKDERIAELEPKAEVADRLLNAEGDLSVRDAAQALTRAGVKVGQNRLFAALEKQYGWISRSPGDGRYRVKQTAIESGWMSVIPQSHYHPKTGVLVLDPPQPRVTPKGLQRILTDHGGDPGDSALTLVPGGAK